MTSGNINDLNPYEPRGPLYSWVERGTVRVACVTGVQRGGRGKLNASAKRDESVKRDRWALVRASNDRASRSHSTSPLPLCTPATQATVRVKCLPQQHNTMTRPGLKPGPFDPETSALTIRPPRLAQEGRREREISWIWTLLLTPKTCNIYSSTSTENYKKH